MKKEREIRKLYDKTAASERYALYKAAIEQLKKAYDNGFYIEAVAICESLISDRLHARYSHLKQHEKEARREKDLGKLIILLKNNDLKKFADLHSVYDRLDLWRIKRNDAVHAAVKLREESEILTFEERYNQVKVAAEEGRKLFNDLKRETEKLKGKKSQKSQKAKKLKEAKKAQ